MLMNEMRNIAKSFKLIKLSITFKEHKMHSNVHEYREHWYNKKEMFSSTHMKFKMTRLTPTIRPINMHSECN